MIAGFIVADLLATLRALDPVLASVREAVPAGRLADHLQHLEDVRQDVLAEVAAQSAPRITTNLGSLLAERARYAKGGSR